MKYSEAKNETKGEKIMITKETKNFKTVEVLRERERERESIILEN